MVIKPQGAREKFTSSYLLACSTICHHAVIFLAPRHAKGSVGPNIIPHRKFAMYDLTKRPQGAVAPPYSPRSWPAAKPPFVILGHIVSAWSQLANWSKFGNWSQPTWSQLTTGPSLATCHSRYCRVRISDNATARASVRAEYLREGGGERAFVYTCALHTEL